MKIFLIPSFLLIAVIATGQESESNLRFNADQHERYNRELRFEPRSQRNGGGNDLPFFDDFARYSLPTDDPEIPLEWQMWEDDDVFINGTFPVSPPTIGVATLEGLGPDGCPYDFTNENSWGPADTLTSIPLNLASYSADDNVYLTFFYEPGGLGNNPDEEDSLIVEFYSPFGAGQWIRQWAVPGSNNVVFQQVFLPISAPEFLLDGFKFRFRNYATLSGNVDHWHIDYVIVDTDIDPNSFLFDEVAMQYPLNTLLEEYTAMPLTHFLDNPAGFVLDQVTFKERNLGGDENIVTSMCIANTSTNVEICLPDDQRDFNVTNNGFQEISRPLTISSIMPFDALEDDTCLIYDVNVFINTTDAHLANDSTRFMQTFYNYYAYDDGTAERAWNINVAGGSVAMKYFCEVPDTLLGLFIHWIPFQYDVSTETFLLRIWGDDGGVPGNELAENFLFHSPAYWCNGYNTFSYYAYDEEVPVDGTFYCGWVQDSNAQLNVGNDKNTNSNPAKLFYKLGGGAAWTQSIITGSVMIRPVFKSGKSNVWNDLGENAGEILNLYPNPAEDMLYLSYPGEGKHRVECFDISGKLVISEEMNLNGSSFIDISTLSSGIYNLVLSDQSGSSICRKFVRQ